MPVFLIDLESKHELLPHPPDLHPSDNPYLPRHLQGSRLDLQVELNNFAVPEILPTYSLRSTDKIDGGHVSPWLVATPMLESSSESLVATSMPVHDDMMLDERVANADDNSSDSDSLEPLEDHEFPDYFTEYGSPLRLFHSHGAYGLPVDSNETKRQQAQHILLRMIFGNVCGAPIRDLLSAIATGRECKVVDFCTGSGDWVLEMAKDFPHVQFRGLDLVPIQTRYPPQNVRFEITDVTGFLRFPDASVDVVHARMTCLRAEAVPLFLQEVARILRPGGLFLFADWQLRPTLHPCHPSSEEIEVYMPRTVALYNAVSYSGVVSNWALQFPHLIRYMGSFVEPISRQWAMPISAPYSSNLNYSQAQYSSHQFISEVMTRISHGFADALVAGGHLPHEVARAFKDELGAKKGICSIYQTVWARKREGGRASEKEGI